jgi:N-acetyl-anhydromuramyl-L-alanine amidase AmpD
MNGQRVSVGYQQIKIIFIHLSSLRGNIMCWPFKKAETVKSPSIEEVLEVVTTNKIEPLDLMSVRFHAAANQSSRRDSIRAIVLHHIFMGSFEESEEFLVSKESGVSAHYLAGMKKDETVQMVNTKKKAWHAGISEYTIHGIKRTNLNNCTIGIEVLNPGVLTKVGEKFQFNNGGEVMFWDGEKPPVKTLIKYPSGRELEGYCIPYPIEQIHNIVALCKGIIKKYPQIEKDDILTHYQIAQPEGRKNDPFGLDINYIKRKVFE